MLNPCRSCCVFLLSCLATPFASRASTPQASTTQPPARTSVLSGDVSDPTGAKLPDANVHLDKSTLQRDVKTDANGHFTVNLPAGVYDVTIVAAGFSPFITTIKLGSAATSINARLAIATESEEVDVAADASSTAAGDNKSALVLGQKELETMSDNDDTFQQQIQALAGADPMSPSGVYVDGFSGGQMPPKDAIREIRINSNPFSAQFQELGFGRVEIFTKPGADTLHANISVFASDSPFNAQNPYSTTQPPYYMLHIRGNVSGPIGKKTSYFVGIRYNDQQNNSVIDALATETSNLPFNAVVSSPNVSEDYNLRLDRQVTSTNVLTARWEFQHSSLQNCGLSGCTPSNDNGPSPAAISSQVLPSQAYNGGSNVSTLQLSDSQDISKNKVLETRFQWIRNRSTQLPLSTANTVNVSGYFNGGGSPTQTSVDHTDRIEFQEYFSLEQGKHFWRIGGRYRGIRDANFSNAGFNGAYTYTTLGSYNVGEPSQFLATAGSPKATLYTGDLGIYVDDEYKARKNVTLNYGMRFETQSAIPDHFDPAPRVGAAWDVGKTDKRQPFVTLRAGMGIFYDRFESSNLLTAVRQQQGGLQQQYIFTLSGTSPAMCAITPVPSCTGGSVTTTPPTYYGVSPTLRSEYKVVEGLTAEKGTKYGKISATYLHVQGDHQWTSRNINAPLPGTYVYGDTSSGTRPYGGTNNLYQFDSNGTSMTNSLMGNAQLNFGKRFSYWLWAGDRFANGDAQGAGSFPTNQYNQKADYGRQASPTFRLFTGGSVDLPWGIALDPFIAITSSQPFNITTGTDLNGDTQYNDRPSFATAASPSVISTKYGSFDPTPVAGETIIPVNYANGPRFAYTELYASKSFHFGPALPMPPAPKLEPGKPTPKPVPPQLKYRLTFAAEVDNIFNHPNRSTPVSVLTSPDFGKTLSLNSTFIGSPNANRMIFLATSFHF
jgi:hypothetical protein